MAKKVKKVILKKLQPQINLPTEKTQPATRAKDYILCFYGPPGVGKTTFVDGLAQKTLFISTDRGTRFFTALREEIDDLDGLLAVLKALESPGAPKYDIICLDHADDICGMVEDHVCEKLEIESLGEAGWGAGWKAYKKAIDAIVHRILRLDVGLVIICHETIKTIRTRVIETERVMPDLSKSAWKVIIPKCDIVGYCGFKIVKRRGEKQEIRVLETEPREELYCKDRTDRGKPTNRTFNLLDSKEFMNSFLIKGVTKNGESKKKKVNKRKKR